MRLIDPQDYDDIKITLDGLDEDSILCGPGRDANEAEICPSFAAKFPEALRDCLYDAGHHGDDIREKSDHQLITMLLECAGLKNPIIDTEGHGLIVPLLATDGYEIGIIGVDTQEDGTWDVSGIFFGPTLIVSPAHRGNGVGTALAAARLLKYGDLSTWEHDTPGYTPGGQATVTSGLHLAKNMLVPSVELKL